MAKSNNTQTAALIRKNLKAAGISARVRKSRAGVKIFVNNPTPQDMEQVKRITKEARETIDRMFEDAA